MGEPGAIGQILQAGHVLGGFDQAAQLGGDVVGQAERRRIGRRRVA